jgi:hypothetical protein
MARKSGARNGGRLPSRLLSDRDDHFVRTDKAEFAADHLVRQIRVGFARIEQHRAMSEPIPLLGQLRQLNRPLSLELAVVAQLRMPFDPTIA